VGNFEMKDIRPPRFIGRDGVVRPFSPGKALGTALLRAVDEGKFVNQFYHGHVKISKKAIILVLDRSVMLIEKHVLRDVLGDGGWGSQLCVWFKHLQMPPVRVQESIVVFNYKPGKERSPKQISGNTAKAAQEAADLIHESYNLFHKEF
jgi:hypothetical protein